MPQVSRHPLDKQTKDKILTILFEAILKLNDEKMVKHFVNDLLTPTEKIMLAKRLTAAVFLERGYNYQFIAKILKITPTTINTIKKELTKGGEGLRYMARVLSKTSKLEKLLNKLDAILGAFTLPVKGSKSSTKRWQRDPRRL